VMWPASDRSAPLRIFISVDFPAPFSPMSACTSPGATSNETPRKACVEPKRLWMASMPSRRAEADELLLAKTFPFHPLLFPEEERQVPSVQQLDRSIVHILPGGDLEVGVLNLVPGRSFAFQEIDGSQDRLVAHVERVLEHQTVELTGLQGVDQDFAGVKTDHLDVPGL